MPESLGHLTSLDVELDPEHLILDLQEHSRDGHNHPKIPHKMVGGTYASDRYETIISKKSNI